MYPSVSTAVDFITQNGWDIPTYLKDMLHIFYIAIIELSVCYYLTSLQARL